MTERLSLYCSAPHHGWQFKALAYNWADQTLYWSEATNRKIQVIFLQFILNAQSKLDFLPFVRRSRCHIPFFSGVLSVFLFQCLFMKKKEKQLYNHKKNQKQMASLTFTNNANVHFFLPFIACFRTL